MKTTIALFLIAGLSLGISVRAEEPEPRFYFNHLTANDPNFFGVGLPHADDKLDDESHLEFYLSIQSPLWIKPNDWGCLDRFMQTVDHFSWIPDRTLFIYNGAYDFYLNSSRYTSAPIISRRQNPGATFEWDTPKNTQLRLGYFHESNGQTLSDSNAYAVAENDFGEDYALSQVSRGWDYMNFRVLFDSNTGQTNHPAHRFKTSVELRHYFDFQGFGTLDREENIFWADVRHQPQIQDYDGLRLMAEYTKSLSWLNTLNGIMVRVETRTGIGSAEGLEHLSNKFTCNLKLWNTWFSSFYFNGFGKEPATYHERTEYFGVGIELR